MATNDIEPRSRRSGLTSSRDHGWMGPFGFLPTLFGGLIRDAMTPLEALRGGGKSFVKMPNVEIRETEDAYMVDVEIPGVPREAIEIDIVGNRLVVSADRQDVREEGGHRGRRTFTELRYGHLERSFDLPDDVDADNVQAECRHGVLEVRIPRMRRTRRGRIEIKEKAPEAASPAPS